MSSEAEMIEEARDRLRREVLRHFHEAPDHWNIAKQHGMAEIIAVLSGESPTDEYRRAYIYAQGLQDDPPDP